MAGVLPIEKDLIPYQFDILLSNKTFTIQINYNEFFNKITVDLLRNGTALVQGEKIVYNVALFETFQRDSNYTYNENYFTEILLPLDPSDEETEVTFTNLQDTVFIYILEDETG